MILKTFKYKIVIIFAVMGMFISYGHAADFGGWKSDASALPRVLEAATVDQKPVILYFHATWCGWCQKFNEIYLPSDEVNQYLNRFEKFQFLENSGAAYRALKRTYGVFGYPSIILLVPSIDDRGVKVSPFLQTGEVDAAGFVELMKRSVRGQYAKKGVSLMRQKQYADAVTFFRLAIEYAGEDANMRCAMGTAYYYQAYTERNTQLLNDAESQYVHALELQPDYAECRKNYNNLMKTKASVR